MRVDVTDEASVASMFVRAEKELGSIALLINCVGFGVFSPVQEISLHEMKARGEGGSSTSAP
jgi:short-subunit dehydrogenase